MRYNERWHPTQHDLGYATTTELTRGTLFILNRQPVRHWDTFPRPYDRWPSEYMDAWQRARAYTEGSGNLPDPTPGPMPNEWRHRPMVIAVLPDTGPDLPPTPATKPTHYLVQASRSWYTLPEHYAVCARCGELPPCTHIHNERVGQLQAKALEKRLSLMEGCCHYCHSPITARQKTITFPGENLMRPDFGPDSSIFHARGSCRAGVLDYDKKWAQATGAPHRFHCSGTATRHANGEITCTQELACPRPDAWHACDINHYREYADRGGYSGCWCVAADLSN